MLRKYDTPHLRTFAEGIVYGRYVCNWHVAKDRLFSVFPALMSLTPAEYASVGLALAETAGTCDLDRSYHNLILLDSDDTAVVRRYVVAYQALHFHDLAGSC